MINKIKFCISCIFLTLVVCKVSAAEITYEDRQDVLDLINKYSFGVDTYDTALLMTLFTEDGVFRVFSGGEQLGNREGSEQRYIEFTERVARRIQNGTGQSRHFITNIVIEMPSAEKMSATVMAMSTNLAPGAASPTINSIGYYDFEFTQVDSEWKISSLELHYD